MSINIRTPGFVGQPDTTGTTFTVSLPEQHTLDAIRSMEQAMMTERLRERARQERERELTINYGGPNYRNPERNTREVPVDGILIAPVISLERPRHNIASTDSGPFPNLSSNMSYIPPFAPGPMGDSNPWGPAQVNVQNRRVYAEHSNMHDVVHDMDRRIQLLENPLGVREDEISALKEQIDELTETVNNAMALIDVLMANQNITDGE